MLTAYLSTLIFLAFCYGLTLLLFAYGIKKDYYSPFSGLSALSPKANLHSLHQYEEGDKSDTRPDDEMPDPSEQDLNDRLGSEQLHIKQARFDEKMLQLERELALGQRPGHIYDEDSTKVDQIIANTHEEEYAK